MVVERYIERLLNDEGLTDGIADAEASVLLRWAEQQVENRIPSVATSPQAEVVFAEIRRRVRTLAKVVEALCYDESVERAGEHEPGLDPTALAKLQRLPPDEVMQQLLLWETANGT